jgi:genome maintenance exonuclease 1
MFNHIKFDSNGLEVKRVNVNGSRMYETADGKRYPSITTVLSHFTKDAIMAWRKRVGEKEANRVSVTASRRGTNVHQMCEDYINNNDYKEGQVFSDIEDFLILKPELDRLITDVYCQEWFMYSDHLGIAGTCDCVALVNGKLSIIDFKTSKRSLTLYGGDKLKKYYAQCAGYAVMFEERTGIPVSQVVIIAKVDGKTDAEVYIEKRDNWIHSLIDMIKVYKQDNGLTP